MQPISLTSQQRRAVETTGRSVIVSAAAGSGKTAVLAQRCAYLVCDAPPAERCNVDELLVLTFTEAAAAEMRSRIAEAIRARFEIRPCDDRLGRQVALVDVAQVSTIHSFCLWLLRRWFSEVGIDPTATILDQDEAALLRSEVLESVFSQLYAKRSGPDDPLGVVKNDRVARSSAAWPWSDEGGDPTKGERGAKPSRDREGAGTSAKAEPNVSLWADELPQAFVRLIDDYGLGSDRSVARFVLELFEFTASLPDPTAWLREAADSIAHRPRGIVLQTLASLQAELHLQIEHCAPMVSLLREGDPSGHFYADRISDYHDELRTWANMLDEVPESLRRQGCTDSPDAASEKEIERVLALYEQVSLRIAEFEFSKKRGPRLSKDGDPAVIQARDAASAQLSDVKQRLFGRRLKTRYALFSVEQWLDGLGGIAPYVDTIVGLVTLFGDAYTARKRRLDVLDFSDLERLAYDLLHNIEDPDQPTDVARALRRRFAHVLIDEFQDVNPIQQAIIRTVSREPDPDQPNNLFVVGDVKQSIYRFRLAEPAIFTERLATSRAQAGSDIPGCPIPSSGEPHSIAIALQENFRSRRPILDAVNLVFTQLMRPGVGDVIYDDEANLHPGREPSPDQSHQPVEFHLLEGSWSGGEGEMEPEEPGVVDLDDPARWTRIEREAYLIGSRIRAWIKGSEPSPTGEPLRYRDVTVLLRAARINAEKISAVLSAMGIDAYADVGGSLFAALEVRDVLAALQVMDNLQQDIPLASVLRSGIFGEPLTEDDLVDIRCLDRDIPFNEAVRNYAHRPSDSGLGDRLGRVIDRIGRYRNEVGRRPLADVLWSLYKWQGSLAYVGGLPGGACRRANLLKLHELARKFGSFRRQGLHRFLSFIKSLEEREQTIASAPAIGESEDVVRIMSIHQSKGLEFPVVFVAGLGTKFNLGDRSGSMIFERRARIGLRVIDTEQMIEYPSAVHHLVAFEIESATREEELRILYVAMTRARDKLVLLGSRRDVQKCREMTRTGPPGPPSRLEITTAVTPLDWLIPAVTRAAGFSPRESTAPRAAGFSPRESTLPGAVGFSPGESAESKMPTNSSTNSADQPVFDLRFHDVAEMAAWRVAGEADRSDGATLEAAARGQPLPAEEPLAPYDEKVEEVLSRIDYTYPSLASASIRAAVAASEFKGAYDFTRDPDFRSDRREPGETFRVPRSKYASDHDRMGAGVAAHRGIVTHRVLQHLDFAVAGDEAGVASELQRMQAGGLLTADDRELVDESSLVWFVGTPLAEAIRKAGGAYRREFQFIATESPGYFDRSAGSLPGDEVLVRGIVDGILPVGVGNRRLAAIEIVDFKTDRVSPDQVASRAEAYRPQMELYARAMATIWRKPVGTCWLVFMSARRVLAMGDVGDRSSRLI